MRVWTRAWVRVERAGAPAVWWLEDFESASLDHHKISLDRKQKRDRKRSRMAGPKMVSPGETKNGPAWRDRKRSRQAGPEVIPPGGTKKWYRHVIPNAISLSGPARRDHFRSRQAGPFSVSPGGIVFDLARRGHFWSRQARPFLVPPGGIVFDPVFAFD